MKRSAYLMIALAVVLVLVLYSINFRVAYYQTAIKTTFGRADEGSVINASADGAGADGSGLYFKWPYPFQEVVVYDRRVQLIEDRMEEIQMADRRTVTVSMNLMWRISDPLKFYRSLSSTGQADGQLKNLLRDNRGEIVRYALADLLNPSTGTQSMQKIEESIRGNVQGKVKDYGITIESVGLRRLSLAQAVTTSTFDFMKAERQRRAEGARIEGRARASEIRASAQSNRDRILAFANQRAQEIMSEGDRAAAELVKVFNEAPEFATFLREIEALQKSLKNFTQFYIQAKDVGSALSRRAESIIPPSATRPSRALDSEKAR